MFFRVCMLSYYTVLYNTTSSFFTSWRIFTPNWPLLSALDTRWHLLRLVTQLSEQTHVYYSTLRTAVVSLLSKAILSQSWVFSFVWTANLPTLVEMNWVGHNATL